MRILLILLKTFLYVAVAVAVVFFGTREVLLWYARVQLAGEVEKLRTVAKNSNEYALMCKSTFTFAEDTFALAGVQIRFLDDHTYQSEVVCAQRARDPIPLRSGSLPYGVARKPGSSGLLFVVGSPAHTLVELTFLWRTIQYSVIDVSAKEKNVDYPVAACAGWGYACCDTVTQVPKGIAPPGDVSDCRSSCYSACQNRPIILSFRSDPPAPFDTRTVRLINGQHQATLAYIVAGSDAPIKSVIIDFGDGATQRLTEERDSVSHDYVCTQPSCQYTASITATDVNGLESPSLQTSMLNIVLEQ